MIVQINILNKVRRNSDFHTHFFIGSSEEEFKLVLKFTFLNTRIVSIEQVVLFIHTKWRTNGRTPAVISKAPKVVPARQSLLAHAQAFQAYQGRLVFDYPM